MKCDNCGSELVKGAKFCVFCGMPLSAEQIEAVNNGEDTIPNSSAPKTEAYHTSAPSGDTSLDWLAGLGMVCGVVSLAAFYLCIPSLAIGILGIVFSSKGLNSNLRTIAIIAMILSIAGCIMSSLSFILWRLLINMFGWVLDFSFLGLI